jgi:hypothetical protein
MKKKLLFASLMAILMLAGAFSSTAQKVNKLTKQEKKEGWYLLFNGKNFDGWRRCNNTDMPDNWVVEDGAMKIVIGPDRRVGREDDRDILYNKKFKNFELSIDWKASDKANSGIFYNIREIPKQPIYYAAPEIQILDNENGGDNKVPNHLAGSLYDMLPCDPKTVHPAGQWNTIVIKMKDGHVTHTMNGVEVVSYTLWTPEWDKMVMNSKFKTFKGFMDGVSKEGYIGLQDHGYTVWFRNVKIREL